MISQGAYRLNSLHALDAARVQAIMARGSSDDSMVRAGVAGALFHATDYAGTTLPVVLKLVAETNTFIRANATRTLLHYGQVTNIDLALRLAALEPALEFGDTSGRWNALETVLTLKTNTAPLARLTIALLSEKNERVRAKAAEAVGSLGPAAREAEPMLRSLLGDKWSFVRESAEAALEKIKPRPPPQ
jgi:HEAT repeat protein